MIGVDGHCVLVQFLCAARLPRQVEIRVVGEVDVRRLGGGRLVVDDETVGVGQVHGYVNQNDSGESLLAIGRSVAEDHFRFIDIVGPVHLKRSLLR